jgi:4-amino-4-deoxy-L-arabinose transferase-like glycosyltransferase
LAGAQWFSAGRKGWRQQAVRLEPGFVGHFNLLGVSFALLGTLVWCWLIVTSPRSPMRGIMHWMAGLTLFWLLIATLWMPWIDYGKTYRQVSASLAKALPEKRNCIAGANLADSISPRWTISTVSARLRQTPPPARSVTAADMAHPMMAAPRRWRLAESLGGGRPAERRDNEKLHLYRREARRGPSPAGRCDQQ